MTRAKRETKLEWLETVPEHWSEREVGREVWVRARLGWKGLTANEYVETGVPMLATPDIKGPEIAYNAANKITVERYDESPDIQLRPGDVLLTKDGNTIGTVNVVRELPGPATVNGSIAVLTPRHGLDGRFLYWFIASSYAQSMFDRLRGGMGVPHLFQRDINRIRFPYPPVAEQRAIADYLDQETAQIDALVDDQNRLLELLRERRQAVLFHAIHKAASGSIRDKLSRFARIGNGSTPQRDNPRYWSDQGFPWLNSSVVNQTRVTQAEQFVTSEALANCHLPIVAANSVLVGLTGQGRTRGMATLLSFSATVNQHIAYVTPDPARWLPDYLLWSLRASYADLRQISEENGSTKGGLTCQALKEFRLARPPLDEQRRVASYLNAQTQKIDEMMVETGRFIELSKERRAALITAAVTGQINLRDDVA